MSMAIDMDSGLSQMASASPADVIEHMATVIIERFHPRRLILFGSHARSQATSDSDIDLFVEMDSALRPPERAAAIDAAFGLHPWAMDIVVYTPAEVARLRGRRGSLLETIEREGQVLYERR